MDYVQATASETLGYMTEELQTHKTESEGHPMIGASCPSTIRNAGCLDKGEVKNAQTESGPQIGKKCEMKQRRAFNI
jgi:hypothetical protein